MFSQIFALIIVQVTFVAIDRGQPLTITNGHCEKNISVKYQVPVTKTRLIRHTRNPGGHQGADGDEAAIAIATTITPAATEQYTDYEDRIRYDTVQVCCPGYRTLIFGFCEPICTDACPPHSYCGAPNKCECMRGYEASHHSNKENQLICRPICIGGCAEHGYCVGPNDCDCRAGYKDVSSWFRPLRCERIQCAAADQRYDMERKMCIKIEMSVEELMQKVAAKLSQGLDDVTEYAADDVDDDMLLEETTAAGGEEI